MMSIPRSASSLSIRALAVTLALAAVLPAACASGGGGYRGGKKSEAFKWLESPSRGKRDGNKILIPEIGMEFEIPETLYVFKNCDETGHSAGDGPEKSWVSLASCSSSGVSSGDVDAGASSSESETIALTFYLAPKERPVDERAVAYFNNSYQQAGLKVEDLSYNDDYFQKTGIYAKLQVTDESGVNAVREIQQFMFPYGDVLFIARMEYPFGDPRAVQQDWKAIMPYFKVTLER